MNRLKISAIFLGFIVKGGWAGLPEYRNKVTETKTCASILTVLGDHSIHVQDLDNTIMAPVQTLGSDQWFSDLVSRFVARGLSKAQAADRAMEMWIPVQRVTKMKALEDFIPNMISFLIQESDHLRDVALTARPADLADATLRQLTSLGIDFSKRNPFGGAKRVVVNAPEFAELVLIKGGVIFVGQHNDKGKVLAFLLDPKNGYNAYPAGFERVVFADDKLHHNESVLREVRAQFPEITVYAFRDGAADERVKNYNPKIADAQWEEFQKSGNLISDEEALRRLTPKN